MDKMSAMNMTMETLGSTSADEGALPFAELTQLASFGVMALLGWRLCAQALAQLSQNVPNKQAKTPKCMVEEEDSVPETLLQNGQDHMEADESKEDDKRKRRRSGNQNARRRRLVREETKVTKPRTPQTPTPQAQPPTQKPRLWPIHRSTLEMT